MSIHTFDVLFARSSKHGRQRETSTHAHVSSKSWLPSAICLLDIYFLSLPHSTHCIGSMSFLKRYSKKKREVFSQNGSFIYTLNVRILLNGRTEQQQTEKKMDLVNTILLHTIQYSYIFI